MLYRPGLVGRMPCPTEWDEYGVDAPPPTSSESFLTSLPAGWTLTRASANATNCTYLDGSTVTTYTTYAANLPRFTAFGMLIEPGRTNIFLNSDAPVTQTITVALGPYIVWMLGTGSVVAAAGSAVGTGFGSATAGNFLSLVITTAGTITVTCTAPVLRVQVEGGTSPSSYIPTTGIAVSRAVEQLSCSGASLNLAEGTYLVEFMLSGAPNNNGRIFMAGSNPLGSALDADQMWMDVVAPRLISTVMDSAGNMPGYSQVPYTAPVFSVTRAAVTVSAEYLWSALNGVVGTSYNPGPRPTALTTLAIMSGGGPPPINGILRNFRYWSHHLSEIQIQQITSAGYFRDPPVFDFDLKQPTIPRRLSFYKGNTSGQITTTDASITDASGAPFNTYGMGPAAIIPRTSPQGVWLEQGRTQYIGQSNIPGTRLTATLANNQGYILFVNGSGSARVTAGTAIPIFDAGDTATYGNPIKFNIVGSANGNVNVTLTGTLNWWQMENLGPNSAVPGVNLDASSFIQAGNTGSRGTESLYMKAANWYNADQHTYLYEGMITGRAASCVLASVFNSPGEREQLYAPLTDGNTGVGMRITGERHNNNVNYGGIYQAQADQPLNTIFKVAYAIDMAKRTIVVNGIIGETSYNSGPSLYPTDFIINNQRVDITNSFVAGFTRVRRMQMYDYAMTPDEMASLTAGAGEALDLDFMQPGTLPAGMTFTRASVATYFDSAGVMQTAATGVARWEYDPVTHVLRGLLIEEQRINILLNAATLVTQSVTVTATAYTLSFYGTGTVTLSGVATGTLVGVGAMPNRVTMTFTPTAGLLTLTVTGSVVSAQLEAGAFATSYIPTTVAAVTRIKELLTMPAGSFGSMFTGTMFVEGMQMGLWSKPATYFAISTVGKLGFIVQAANQLAYFENLGLNQQMGEVPTGRPFKAAFSFTPTAQSGALDGVLSLANSYALPATTRSTIVVGTDTNVQQPNGYIRRAKIWTRTMPDEELIALTR